MCATNVIIIVHLRAGHHIQLNDMISSSARVVSLATHHSCAGRPGMEPRNGHGAWSEERKKKRAKSWANAGKSVRETATSRRHFGVVACSKGVIVRRRGCAHTSPQFSALFFTTDHRRSSILINCILSNLLTPLIPSNRLAAVRRACRQKSGIDRI